MNAEMDGKYQLRTKKRIGEVEESLESGQIASRASLSLCSLATGRCVFLQFSVRWTRAKMEQLTRAPARLRTMREQRHREHGTDGLLPPANLELPNPSHPRTWDVKNEHDLSVARSCSTVALSGSQWRGSQWLDCGFGWIGVARQWL